MVGADVYFDYKGEGEESDAMLVSLNDIAEMNFHRHENVSVQIKNEEDGVEYMYPGKITKTKKPTWTKVVDEKKGKTQRIRCERSKSGQVLAPNNKKRFKNPVPEGEKVDDYLVVVTFDEGKGGEYFVDEMFVAHPRSGHLEGEYFEQGNDSLMKDKLDGFMRVHVRHPLVDDKLFKFYYNFGAKPPVLSAHAHVAAQKVGTSKVNVLRSDGTRGEIDIENVDLHLETADGTDQCWTWVGADSKWNIPEEIRIARRASALKTPSPKKVRTAGAKSTQASKKVKTSKVTSFTEANALASEEESRLDDRESLQGIHLMLVGIKNTISGVEKMLKAELSKNT